VYSHLDHFFHPNEDSPPLIQGFEFRIITEPGRKAVGHRNKHWDFIAQKYLKVKELELVRTNKCRRSTSACRNPIQLVPYMERIKDFLDKHGEKSVELMDDPAYAKIVSKVYRMTIDMRLHLL
jgi:hypothetical protein